MSESSTAVSSTSIEDQFVDGELVENEEEAVWLQASWRRYLRSFRKNKLALIGAIYLVILLIVAAFGPWIATHDPNEQDLMSGLLSPSTEHFFGTDLFGRDLFSRVVHGTRVSLLAGLEAVTVALVLGTLSGLAAGYRDGWTDSILTFINNTILGAPGLVLAIAVVTSLGPGLTNAMFAIGIIFTPRFYRLVRSSTQIIKAEPYISASVSVGCKPRRVLFAHILPNALPPLLVDISLVFGTAILAEAALSYLGLGVQPPTASWGSLMSQAANQLDEPHLLWFPGITLILTVLSLAYVADGIRDALSARRH